MVTFVLQRSSVCSYAPFEVCLLADASAPRFEFIATWPQHATCRMVEKPRSKKETPRWKRVNRNPPTRTDTFRSSWAISGLVGANVASQNRMDLTSGYAYWSVNDGLITTYPSLES